MGRLLDEGVNIILILGVCGEKIIIVEEQNDGAVIGSHFNICSHLHIEHTPITSMSGLLVLVLVLVSFCFYSRWYCL